MNILARYGIKEVADVTFYEIIENADGTTGIGAPVLYLDTLKVSTIEQTAENTEARGGKGNAALISWDYGKEITVTLEDALYSAKSLAIMFGDVNEKGQVNDLADNVQSITKTVWKEQVKGDIIGTTDNPTAEVVVNGVNFTLTNCKFYNADGTVGTQDGYVYLTGTLHAGNTVTIEVSAGKFPGTYYVTGDTYARNENTGKDEFFQFIIYKAKVLSESVSLTLEAEGDPTVFSMSLKVLRPKDGVMMRLVQYDLNEAVQMFDVMVKYGETDYDVYKLSEGTKYTAIKLRDNYTLSTADANLTIEADTVITPEEVKG